MKSAMPGNIPRRREHDGTQYKMSVCSESIKSSEATVAQACQNDQRAARGTTRRTILKVSAKVVAALSMWAAGSRGLQASRQRSLKWVAFYGLNADEKVLS